jgi:hypothetical protein
MNLRSPAGALDRRRITNASAEPVGDYTAVSVSCGPNACAAAVEIAGRRMLESEAPQLPLSKCSAEQCDCRFFHYRDRRSFLGNRRANNLDGAVSTDNRRRNRRKGPNRRQLRLIGAG